MNSFIRNAAVLSVLVGVAGAACSSSNDSGTGGSGNGGSAGATTGGTSNGGKGGASGGTASGGGGATSAGSGGTSSADGGKAGAGTAGSESAGAGDSAAGADNGAAGAPGSGPQMCNALSFAGELLNLQHTSAAVPTLSNGTLQAGDYRLTSGGIYDGGTGTFQFGSVVHVSIADSTATIAQADSDGHTSTLVIVMGQPSSSPPTSVKLTCDTDATLASGVGVEASGAVKYGVTGSTFSLYEGPLKLLLVYTLQ